MMKLDFRIGTFFLALLIGSLGRLYLRVVLPEIERRFGRPFPASFSPDAPQVVAILATVNGLIIGGGFFLFDFLGGFLSGTLAVVEALLNFLISFGLSTVGYAVGHLVVAWVFSKSVFEK